jgi:hypothetical protein
MGRNPHARQHGNGDDSTPEGHKHALARWWRRIRRWPQGFPARQTAAPPAPAVLRPHPVPYPVPDSEDWEDRTRFDLWATL